MATTQAHDNDPQDHGDTVVAVPVRPEAIFTARRAVQQAAARAGLGRDRIDDLVIAVSEACTNALEANQRAGCDDPIVVTCAVVAGTLEVAVSDCGAGFEPSALAPRPPLTDPAHLDVERGWGIQLMRELVDELLYDHLDTGGMTVRLRMSLPR